MEDDIARTREGREIRTHVTLREGPHRGHACLPGSYLCPPVSFRRIGQPSIRSSLITRLISHYIRL